MRLLILIALKHLLSRRRQSLVSLSGIVLGVAFFLTISSLMRGSEKDFIRRLVDNSPHITIVDEFRNPRLQPIEQRFPRGAVELRSVKPVTETRGIRGYERIITRLGAEPGVLASPVMASQAVVSFAGKEHAVTLNGMIPADIKKVTTIEQYVIAGSIDALAVNPDGIIVGSELARKLSLNLNDNLTVTSVSGQTRTFKILGLFRVGRSDFDQQQAFITIKRSQALFNRTHRANSVLIKLQDPYRARDVAARIEAREQYKAVSWQEASEDIMNTLHIRNIIMYTVVSAVLVVAAFGIYNVISTVVIEKHRDIAILKSIGFHGPDISLIFLIEGTILGVTGAAAGLPLGAAMMSALIQIRFKPPGGSEVINMPVEWNWVQFAVAASFAIFAAMLAAWLPARKAAEVEPVAILRGTQ